MSLRVLASVVCLQMASAFLSSPAAFGRGALSSVHPPATCEALSVLRMQTDLDSADSCQRRSFLERVGQATLSGAMLTAFTSFTNPSEALAAKGEWAKIDMTGKKGVSGLGENDIPAAGKIDPYDNREKANAEYADRMQDPARIAQKREEAVALKEKVMGAVYGAIENKDWKEAKTILTRDTLPLRRAMNEVSTKGSRAVSAAQRGGDPEKAKTDAEKAEKDFLMSMNRLAVGLDGERAKVDFGKVGKVVQKAEADWSRWLAVSQ